MARGRGTVGGGLPGVLWAGFAVLVAVGGWLFLRACGLDALGLDYCPVPADRSALARERAAGEDLAGQVHMAQMAVAEKPVCTPPAVGPATPVPPPAMPAPPKRAESDAIDRTVVERGGQNGKLQFTLQWNTLDDLDLIVACPGGTIDSRAGHSGPGICGDGHKDIDANRNLKENVSATPVENIVWQTDSPPGRYVIVVSEYQAITNRGNAVPFKLRMRWNDQEKICRDVVTTTPTGTQERDADGIIGGVEKALTWTLGSDLPNCDFVSDNTHRGGTPK